MKRDSSKFQMIKILNEVLEVLRRRLIDEIKDAACPKCGMTIYWGGAAQWANSHLPYYGIEGGKIEVGYRCPKSEDPVVIYRIPLDAILEALEGGEEGTKYLE